MRSCIPLHCSTTPSVVVEREACSWEAAGAATAEILWVGEMAREGAELQKGLHPSCFRSTATPDMVHRAMLRARRSDQ